MDSPCSESVWMVSFETKGVSEKQLQDFPEKLSNLKRSVQPLNNREIYITFLPSYEKNAEYTNPNQNATISNNFSDYKRLENKGYDVNVSQIGNNKKNHNHSIAKEWLNSIINQELEPLDFESFNFKKRINKERFNFIGDNTDYRLDSLIHSSSKKKVLTSFDYELFYATSNTKVELAKDKENDYKIKNESFSNCATQNLSIIKKGGSSSNQNNSREINKNFEIPSKSQSLSIFKKMINASFDQSNSKKIHRNNIGLLFHEKKKIKVSDTKRNIN
jgi:hypothetical protein